MQCKCGSAKLTRRGKRGTGKGYKSFVEQLGGGVSIDHGKDHCLKFERGYAPAAQPMSATGLRTTQWTHETRPQKMETVA